MPTTRPPQLPDRDGRVLLQGPEALPGADAALLHQSRPARDAISAPSRRCRPRTRCSTASSSAASTSGTRPSSAARPPCCAARRSRTTDGFSGVSITEDCETALELHARGWNSVYVDKPLIAGLQPETLRQLHRPALALGAGHDADPALQVPAPQARADVSAAPLLHVEHAVLAVPVLAVLLPRRAAVLPVLLAARSSPHRAASSSPIRSPT